MIRFAGLRHAVKVGFLEAEMVRLLNLASVWSARHGRDIRVTSWNDHDHANKSLHYEDRAIDFQVLSGVVLDKKATADLANHFRGNLGLGWDVVWNVPGHYNHIHVEWDVRQREREEEG